MLAPAPAATPTQVIDGRDLAAWIVDGRRARHGRHVQRRRPAHAARARSSRPASTSPNRTPSSSGSTPRFCSSTRSSRGWSCRSGFRDAEYAGMTNVPADRAIAAGLTTRPLAGHDSRHARLGPERRRTRRPAGRSRPRQGAAAAGRLGRAPLTRLAGKHIVVTGPAPASAGRSRSGSPPRARA